MDRQTTDGQAIAYSTLSMYAICCRALKMHPLLVLCVDKKQVSNFDYTSTEFVLGGIADNGSHF